MKLLLSILLLVTIISIGIGASDCQGPPVPTPPPTAIPGASLEARVTALEQAVAGGGGGGSAPGAYIPILPAAMGGTGTSSYNIGDILYASGTTALNRLGIGISGYYLISNGPNSTTSISWVAPGSSTVPITSVGQLASGALVAGFTSVNYTMLENFSSNQLGLRLTDETGTGVVVYSTSAALTTPTLTSPTVTGGSFTTPTLATPTITGTLIGGAFTTITSASWNSTTSIAYNYLDSAVVATTTYNIATLELAPFPASLSVAWRFEGNTNELAKQRSVGSTALTLVRGSFGQAYDFNGSSSIATVAYTPTATTAMTFSVWIKADVATAFAGILGDFGAEASRTSAHIAIVQEGAGVHIVVSDTATNQISSSTSITLGQWTHIVGVVNSSTLVVYKNGVLSTSDAQAVTPVLAGVLNVGYGSASLYSYFDGQIDEIRVYEKALSAKEVADLYHGFEPRS